jgi:hypothetical protein
MKDIKVEALVFLENPLDNKEKAQKIVDASMLSSASPPPKRHRESIAAAIRAVAEQVIPEETEAPKAEFDCPPRKLYNFGKKEERWGYEHSDYMRRQFAQEKLNIQWEERQSIRSKLLTLIQELENLND